MVDVPSQYQLYVNNAANQLGISPDIVAAQIQTESNWDPNAKSNMGAEGIAQFEPGTFASYGSGSPYNVADAFNAYVNYMGSLLKDENGNIRDALAAYNAGPGDKSAGYSYADGILKEAGTGISSTSTGVANANPALSLNPLSWPDGIVKFFDAISSGVFWMRVLMVAGGGVLVLYALNDMTGLGKKIAGVAKTVANATPEGRVANVASAAKKAKPEPKKIQRPHVDSEGVFHPSGYSERANKVEHQAYKKAKAAMEKAGGS